MSHFFTLVLVDHRITLDEAESCIEPLLEPFSEDGEWFRKGSRWDWWQVGGRYTGALDNYDPERDPANMEICLICGGTGVRPGGREQFGDEWLEWCHGCNGCKGTGSALKWPTKWSNHEGDVLPVKALSLRMMPFAIVTPDGKWYEQARMGWFGATIEDEQGESEKPEALWEATVMSLFEQWPEAYAVVVDCHV